MRELFGQLFFWSGMIVGLFIPLWLIVIPMNMFTGPYLWWQSLIGGLVCFVIHSALAAILWIVGTALMASAQKNA